MEEQGGADSDSDCSQGGLQIHIEEDQDTSAVTEKPIDPAHIKTENKNEPSTPSNEEKEKNAQKKRSPKINEKSKSTKKANVSKTPKPSKTPAKAKCLSPKTPSKPSDESESSNLPEECLILDEKLSTTAEKNNLTDANIKDIIKKVVFNDHVLALVKLKEEELLNEETSTDIKLTRAKTKELMKSCPTGKPPWPLPITPVKNPEPVSPEVSSLILQDLPEEESDEEYNPHSCHESDDDKDTITSLSDLESLPKTPNVLHEIESPVKFADDGLFKIPRDVLKISPEKKSSIEIDDEATIALRTRSKLCLSDTPIENIENQFVPPDVPKDLLAIDDNEIDDVWIDFLTEFTKPLSQTHEEDDDADPEYNAAVEKEKMDSEEFRRVDIQMDEVNDLISELIDSHNICELQESLMGVASKDILNTNEKNEVDIYDMMNLNTPEGDDIQNDNTEKLENIDNIVKTEISASEQHMGENIINTQPEIQEIVVEVPEEIPDNNVEIEKSSGERKNFEKICVAGKVFLQKIKQHKIEKQKHEIDQKEFLPLQREILSQQIRQHVQLLVQGYLQMYGHAKWWMHAPSNLEHLNNFKRIVDQNQFSICNVENLSLGLSFCKRWEGLLSEDTEETRAIFKLSQDSFKIAEKYRKAYRTSYHPKFPKLFFDEVGDSQGIFLYSQLLPKMQFRPAVKVRHYLPSEDRLIACGLEQFYNYVAENDEGNCFTDSLKIAELIGKYTMHIPSGSHLLNHIRALRTPSQNAKGINPIRYFFENLEAPETEHEILSYDVSKKVSDFTDDELPKAFLIALKRYCPRKITTQTVKKERVIVEPDKITVIQNPTRVPPNNILLPKGGEKPLDKTTPTAIVVPRPVVDEKSYKVNVPTLKEYVNNIRKERAKEKREAKEKKLQNERKIRQEKARAKKLLAKAERANKLSTEICIQTSDKNNEIVITSNKKVVDQSSNRISLNIGGSIVNLKGNDQVKFIVKDEEPNEPPKVDTVVKKPTQESSSYKVNVPTIRQYVSSLRKNPVTNKTPSFTPILPAKKPVDNKNIEVPPKQAIEKEKNTLLPVTSNPFANLQGVNPTQPVVLRISDNQYYWAYPLPVFNNLSPNPVAVTQIPDKFVIVKTEIPTQEESPASESLEIPIKTELADQEPSDTESLDNLTITENTPVKTELSDQEDHDYEYKPEIIIKEEQLPVKKTSEPNIEIKLELRHILAIFKKYFNNTEMLPSMPNLSTPLKNINLEISYSPGPLANLDNYQIKVLSNSSSGDSKNDSIGSSEHSNKSKSILSNSQKSKTVPKAQRELEANMAMFVGCDQSSDDQKAFLYARSYFHKIRSRMLNQGNDSIYEEVVSVFNAFDSTSESPCELFKRVEKLFGEEYGDLADDLLTFLTPGQAYELGRFMDYFMMNSMTELFEKLQIYYSKKPGQIKKLIESLQKLATLTEDESQMVESIKATVLPYIRSSQYLTDWFLRLFPEEKPPDSFSKHGYEVLDVEKLAKETDDAILRHEILEIPTEEQSTNEDCVCTCHNSSNEKLKRKSRHCMSCGMKYLQSRIYIQKGKVLRPAHITWEPGSADPSRLSSSGPPRLSRKRSFDQSIQTRGDSDDERLSPKRPIKQLRTPTSKQKLKSKSLLKLQTQQSANDDNLEINEAANDPTESQNEDLSNDAPQAENSSKADAEDWTREEDKEILVALQMENECALEKICTLLPHRTEQQIKDRLKSVMTVLQKIISEK